MSRFDLYGGHKCGKCKHYRKSATCPTMRCDFPGNLRDSYIGVVYLKHPDHINWNYKCPNYKEEEEDGDEI